MLRKNAASFSIGPSIILAVLGCATNVCTWAYVGSTPFKIGDLFYLVAASAQGTYGIILAIGLGVVPETLVTHASGSACAIALSLAAVTFTKKYIPQFPAFLSVLLTWVTIVLPLLVSRLPIDATHDTWKRDQVFIAFLCHVLFAALADISLYNRLIWFRMTGGSRLVKADSLIPHTTGLLAGVSILGAIAFFHRLGLIDTKHMLDSAFWSLIGFTSTVIALATLVGIRIADIFGNIGASPLLQGASLTIPNYLSIGDENPRSAIKPSSSPLKVYEPDALVARGDGICVIDDTGKISFMNSRFRELLDITKDSVVGEYLPTAVHSSGARRVVEHLLLSPHREQLQEARICNESDSCRFVELELIAHDVTASGAGVSLIARDVTAKRTIEQHLLEAQRLSALGDFVSGLAHSFNNSLTAVLGRASHARYLTSIEDMRAAFGDIVSAASAAGETSRKLLEFAQARPTGPQSVDLTRTLPEQISLLQRMLGEQFPIVFENAGDIVSVKIDTVLLSQALTNLLLNARDSYEGKGGPIKVSLDLEVIDDAAASVNPVSQPGTFARIRVTDQGMGMNSEVLARAFDPLFSTKKQSGHAGLGLSSVFSIARAHDGFTTAESKPDKGTSITLYFPLEISDRPVARSSSHSTTPKPSIHRSVPAEIRGKNERILIVEDEQSLRSTVVTMLTLLGYKASACETTDEALSYLSKNSVDLVLLDAYLPRVSGFNLLSDIKSSSNPVMTVMMSGALIKREEVGNTPILLKPFDLMELGKTLRQTIEGNSAGINHE